MLFTSGYLQRKAFVSKRHQTHANPKNQSSIYPHNSYAVQISGQNQKMIFEVRLQARSGQYLELISPNIADLSIRHYLDVSYAQRDRWRNKYNQYNDIRHCHYQRFTIENDQVPEAGLCQLIQIDTIDQAFPQ